MDFASSFMGYTIYALVKYARYVGAIVLALITIALMAVNRRLIVREERAMRSQTL